VHELTRRDRKTNRNSFQSYDSMAGRNKNNNNFMTTMMKKLLLLLRLLFAMCYILHLGKMYIR